MKKIIYFCIVLCLSFLTASFWNCTDSELVKDNPQVPHKDFSLEEAKEFFEKQYLKNVPVTRALNKGKKKRLVTPGDFVPQWEKATASARAGLACYDIPIENDVHYKALYSTYHNGKAKAYSVNVYQKLVVVKNQSTGNMGTYILNLIPTAEYDKKYLKQVANRFVNCADKGGFSGIAFYTIPNLDRILRVNYYENGVKKKGVFLFGKREQMEEKMKVACQILHGVVVKGKRKVTTRGYGEDDWWEYDDWWDDYDDDDDDFYDDTDKEDLLWDVNSGAFLNPDDFDLGNGTFTETEDGVIYVDQNGNVFEMEDTDGDGWLDTPVASEVVIEPEENLDWDTGNEEWMEATRPGGIDYEDPDDEEDDNSNDDAGSNTDSTEGKDKGKNDEQDLSDKQLFYDTKKYPGYVQGVRNCMNVAQSVLKEMLGKNSNIGSSANCVQLWKEIGGKMTLVGDAKEIFDTINSHLNQNRPILTGVDHTPKISGNNDGTTDHWIVINGRGYDESKGQYYFTYIETGRSIGKALDAVSDKNRLYFDETKHTFTDDKAFNGKEYSLTQIRPNK